jgi:hypothetical protein
MSINSENLPLMNKDITERMVTEISLSYVRAYADAALHMPKSEEAELSEKKREIVNEVLENPKNRRKAIEDVLSFAVSEFDGTANEVLLKDAFHNLEMLAKARASTNATGAPQPAQLGFIREYLAKSDEFGRAIEKCVREDSLPQECLEHYNTALAVVTTKTPRQSWVDTVAARKQAMGQTP